MATINFKKSGTYRDLYTGILQIKGTVASTDKLPTESAQFGDIYFVGTSNPVMYTYNGSSWDPFDVEGKLNTVVLNIDNIPSTGTVSSADLDTLKKDNCILIINNKLYYKAYESDNGMDFLPLGVVSYMNGVKKAYFTISKETGNYTIAYSNFVEANTTVAAGQTPSQISNIKVGNTTYGIPRSYVIECENDPSAEKTVIPLEGQPTFAEMFEEFSKGASVTLKVNTSVYTGYYKVISSVYVNADEQAISLVGFSGVDYIHWMNPDYTFESILSN